MSFRRAFSPRFTLRVSVLVSLLASPLWGQGGGVQVEDLPEAAPQPPAPPAAAPAPPPAAPPPATGETPPPAAPASSEPARLEQLAEQRYGEGDAEGACGLYEQAANAQTQANEKVRLFIAAASLRHQLNQAEQTLADLVSALLVDPNYTLRTENFSPSFADVYYEARKRALAERSRQAEDLLRQADATIKGGDWAGARRLLNSALALQPNQPLLLFDLAEVDRHEGKQEQAIAGLQKILSLRTGAPDSVSTALQGAALNNLGILYHAKGFYEDAESVLSEAVSLDPGQAKAWTNLGLARRRLGKKQAAAEAFRRAHELDPADEASISNLALFYIDTAQWTEAVRLLLDSTQRHPSNSLLWLNLGIAQHGLGKEADAIAAFEKTLALDPEDAQGNAHRAASYLALAYTLQGQFDQAMLEARRELQWRPDDVEGWIALGQAQLGANRLEAARDSLEKASTIDPARPEIFNNLGSAYYRLSEYTKAAGAFQRAVSMRSDYVAALDNLNLAKKRLVEIEAIQKRTGLTVGGPRLAGPTGIPVLEVAPQSFAFRAELQPGDLIQKIEGGPVASPTDLYNYLTQTPPLKSLVLEVFRQGKLQRAKLKLQ